MYRLIFLLSAVFLLSSCGPVASKGSQAITKTLNKSAKELPELSDNIIARNLNETSSVANNVTELNTYISKTFFNNSEINYLLKIDEKYSQLPKDYIGAVDETWQTSIRNNESYYNNLYNKYFNNSFKRPDEFYAFLSKSESVLIASILGFWFTYSDDLGAEQGGIIKNKDLKIKPLTDKEIKTIQCSQAHDLVLLRSDISYDSFIKNLDNCPAIKLKLEDLKERLKIM